MKEWPSPGGQQQQQPWVVQHDHREGYQQPIINRWEGVTVAKYLKNGIKYVNIEMQIEMNIKIESKM